MIKNKLAVVSILFILVSPFILTACASSYARESTGQYVDSSAVTLKVKSALLADNEIKSLPITVKTYKGVVQLSGFVDNVKQKARAVIITKHVEGVKRVDDSLVIKTR